MNTTKRKVISKRSKSKALVRFSLFILLLVTVVIGVYGFSRLNFDNRSDAYDGALNTKYLEVGAEEVVISVNDSIKNAPILGVDAPFITMKTNDGVRGYLSAGKSLKTATGWTGGPGETYTFLATTLDQVLTKSAKEYYKPSLMPAQTSTPQDERGSWMMSVMPNGGNNILGWFHGEQTSTQFGSTTMRQFAATSADGGRTWKYLGPFLETDPSKSKPSDVLPQSQITRDDINMNTVIRYNNKLYAMFSHLDYAAGIAEADANKAIAQMKSGKPGAELWKKWLCTNGACGFNSPGVGGVAEKLKTVPYGGAFAYNTVLKRFVSIHATAQWGIVFSTTTSNGLGNWIINNPLVPPVSTGKDPRVDSWDVNANLNAIDVKDYSRLSRLAYTSVIAPDGSMGKLGSEFYLYYVKNPEFSNFYNHTLVRRKVIILPKQTNVPITALNPLVEYQMAGNKKSRTSIDNPMRSDYSGSGRTIGWLATHQAEGFEPIYECYFEGWDNYFIIPSAAVKRIGSEFDCEGEAKFVRLLGYVSKTKTALASIPLGECFDDAKKNHYYVPSATKPGAKSGVCGNNEESWTYGYMIEPAGMNAVAPPKPVTNPPVPAPKPPVTAPKVPVPAPAGPDLPLILKTKVSGGMSKTRLVTSSSKADNSLIGSSEYGRIYKTPGTDRKPLHECYIKIWDDYMLASFDSTAKPTNWCTNSQSETYMGIIGYIPKATSTMAKRLLKECFDQTNLNHFYVTTTNGCTDYANSKSPKPKVDQSWTYGYVK